MLIVIAGLPGSGKSALADALSGRLTAFVVSVDPIENAMLSAGVVPGWEAGVGAYQVAGALAAHNLALGHPVIVDSVSDSEPARQTWWNAAAVTQAVVKVVEVRCPDATEHRRRLEARTRPLTHIAEPTWSEVERRAAAYEPWSVPRLVLDSTRPVEFLVDEVVEYLATDG
jgi:predicted kinase